MARQPGLRILTYHRVADPATTPHLHPALVSATPGTFEASMKTLARRYRVLPIEEVLEHARRSRPLPKRAVLLTFDDAYRDFAETAWPVLRRLRLPATLFVPTAYPGNDTLEFWWDRLYRAFNDTHADAVDAGSMGSLPLQTPAERDRSLTRLLHHLKSTSHDAAMRQVEDISATLGCCRPATPSVLSWDELRALARDSVSIGSHARSHALLTKISLERVRAEIRGSREDLEREIDGVVPVIAYPGGAHDDAVVRVARDEGFELAVTTMDGHNSAPYADPLRLHRTNVTRRTSPGLLQLRLTRAGSALDRWRHNPRFLIAGSRGTRSPLATTAAGGPQDRPKVAYVMSRFPTLSETFVLYEMLAVEALGLAVEVFPLLRQRQRVHHPDAAPLIRRAHYHPFVSLAILRANWRFVRRSPATYLNALREVVRGTWGSRNFFFGAIAIWPKVVCFAEEMERAGVRHIHAHFASHPAVAALIIHRLTGIPFSFTAHGSDLHVDRTMLDRKVDAAQFVVTVAEFNRELMLAECGSPMRDKVHVIHCGVDPTVFSGPKRDEGTDIAILCVARFEEVKGHRFLLQACRLLHDRGVKFVCHLVGEGPLRRALEEQVAALGLRDHVVMHGSCARPQVVQQLHHSDIVVLASAPTRSGKREGIPVALMEAMAAGLPVVAGATGGIPELVESGRTGLLVTPGDVVGLANALEALSTDAALRERLGSAGRARVTQEFNLQRSARRLAALFLEPPSTHAASAA